jgi:hypothetical protein
MTVSITGCDLHPDMRHAMHIMWRFTLQSADPGHTARRSDMESRQDAR